MFYFHPYLGKIPILTNIFQMGWNHQPVSLHIGLWWWPTLPETNRESPWNSNWLEDEMLGHSFASRAELFVSGRVTCSSNVSGSRSKPLRFQWFRSWGGNWEGKMWILLGADVVIIQVLFRWIDWVPFFSHNHGSVENPPKWKDTNIGDTPIFHWTMIMGGRVLPNYPYFSSNNPGSDFLFSWIFLSKCPSKLTSLAGKSTILDGI